MQDQIAFADAKAAVISGIAGGLFVAYREVTRDWRLGFDSVDIPSALRGVLQLPFLAFVFLSVIHGFIVLSPRMPEEYQRAAFGLEGFHRSLERLARRLSGPIDLSGGGELVRWPDIADRERFPRSSDYANAVKAGSTTELETGLAEHSAVLARIVAEKFQHVRLALNYVVLAGLLVAALSLLGQLGRQ